MSYAAPFWATLQPTKLCCTLLSYAAPYLSCAAPSEICCALRAKLHPSELSCTLLSYVAPYWATLYPFELRFTLLSYALPFWATLHPTELRWNLIELRCTLKNIFPPPPHRSFVVPFGKINIIKRNSSCRKNPQKCGTVALLLSYLSYYVPRSPSCPSQLRWSFRRINIKKPRRKSNVPYPAHRCFADPFGK